MKFLFYSGNEISILFYRRRDLPPCSFCPCVRDHDDVVCTPWFVPDAGLLLDINTCLFMELLLASLSQQSTLIPSGVAAFGGLAGAIWQHQSCSPRSGGLEH